MISTAVKLNQNDSTTKKAIGLANNAIASNKENLDELSSVTLEIAQKMEDMETRMETHMENCNNNNHSPTQPPVVAPKTPKLKH